MAAALFSLSAAAAAADACLLRERVSRCAKSEDASRSAPAAAEPTSGASRKQPTNDAGCALRPHRRLERDPDHADVVLDAQVRVRLHPTAARRPQPVAARTQAGI
jgi:hypothetical protein